jgi:hypothetical protein
MYEDTIIEVAPDAIAKTLVIKFVRGIECPEGRYEAHQAGKIIMSWPDEIVARVKLLEIQMVHGYRVIWP